MKRTMNYQLFLTGLLGNSSDIRHTQYNIRDTRLFMQNKPNLSNTQYDIRGKNKPNFESNASSPPSPNGSRFMQNEPNLTKTNVSIVLTRSYGNIPPSANSGHKVKSHQAMPDSTNNQSFIIRSTNKENGSICLRL